MKENYSRLVHPILFSIIIPVYRTEKFLHKCIDSVLSQTYPNFELILVEDPLLILIQAQILSVLQMLAFLGEVQHNHTLLFALQLVAILSSSILITTIERELNIMRERLLVTV